MDVYSKINCNDYDSKANSFEAFAVQLFKTIHTSPGGVFTRVEGRGGDGGVEAYYTMLDGSIIGLQAKYFAKFHHSQMQQLKESITTALKNYPTLMEYHVYIPINLNPTEITRFDSLKTGFPQLILNGEAEITSQLFKHDPNGGMRLYWFDEPVITLEKTKRNFAAAKKGLGRDIV